METLIVQLSGIEQSIVTGYRFTIADIVAENCRKEERCVLPDGHLLRLNVIGEETNGSSKEISENFLGLRVNCNSRESES